MERSVEISHVAGIKSLSADFSCFEKDYVFSRLKPGHEHLDHIPDSPLRFNGLIIMLAMNGIKSVNVNIETIEVNPNSIIVTGPNSIVNVGDVDWDNLEAYLLFVSKEFMQDINIDINVIDIKQMAKQRKPVIALTENETALVRRYLELLHLNATEHGMSLYVKSIARNLVSALMYEIMEITTSRDKEPVTAVESRSRSRRVNYVRDFMDLVRCHYIRERSVGFYADRLYISPKYLSLIIKENTGRSAVQWIDDYVIQEAKNMLRFSGKSIQQIAYDLNFSNQSSFGKYFKHLTGMSPSAFQRS